MFNRRSWGYRSYCVNCKQASYCMNPSGDRIWSNGEVCGSCASRLDNILCRWIDDGVWYKPWTYGSGHWERYNESIGK